MVVRILPYFSQPVIFDICKRLSVGHIIHNKGAHSKPVMRRRDAHELLGSRGVPKLSPYLLITVWKLYRFKCELNTIGCLGLFLKAVLVDSQQEVTLSNLFISDNYKLVEEVKGFIWVFKNFALDLDEVCLADIFV